MTLVNNFFWLVGVISFARWIARQVYYGSSFGSLMKQGLRGINYG
jgi:hypothetical protein